MVFWGIGNHHHLFGQVFAHWTYNNKILGLGLTLEHPGTRRKVDIIIHYSLFIIQYSYSFIDLSIGFLPRNIIIININIIYHYSFSFILL